MGRHTTTAGQKPTKQNKEKRNLATQEKGARAQSQLPRREARQDYPSSSEISFENTRTYSIDPKHHCLKKKNTPDQGPHENTEKRRGKGLPTRKNGYTRLSFHPASWGQNPNCLKGKRYPLLKQANLRGLKRIPRKNFDVKTGQTSSKRTTADLWMKTRKEGEQANTTTF